MIQENVTYFTEEENEGVDLLIRIGKKQNVAKVLVFLANAPESPSRAIERGADLRQPEVSTAVHHLLGQGWIRGRENKAESKGRPLKVYTLAQPISTIIDSLAQERGAETLHQLQIIKKIRNFLP